MHSRTVSRVTCRNLMMLLGWMLLSAGWQAEPAYAADKEDGFESIFDGKTLKGWDGDPRFWRVEDEAITGETTPDKVTPKNTFIIWRGGEVSDFELKFQYRIMAKNDAGFANSGVQYRSFELKDQKWAVGGYQGDFEAGDTFSGILYGEKFRDILANRGEKTELVRTADGKFEKKLIDQVGDSKEIQSKIKKNDWNDYHITARGFHFVHKINGVVTAECTDNDKKMRRVKGILALQLHAGPPMIVQARNIRLKQFERGQKVGQRGGELRLRTPGVAVSVGGDTVRVSVEQGDVDVNVDKGRVVVRRGNLVIDTKKLRLFRDRKRNAAKNRKAPQVELGESVAFNSASVAQKKRIAFVAGTRSHGYGSHEHKAGCLLLSQALEEGLPNFKTVVYTGGWPKDPHALDGFDTLVMYSDGGGGHMVNRHLDQVDALIRHGMGLVCLHYAVEVPKGKSGNKFLDWIGGYFEMHRSVNPHWTAHFDRLPQHPITRGVQPFSVNDEWYYHMRFPKDMQGVTPILTDLPPAGTLVKPDGTLARAEGPHSNNPHVREAVLERKEPQHVAWAYERTDGGRGFGFTGGHVHWNWGNSNFRKLVLNAIVWTAHGDVPTEGVPTKAFTLKDLTENQDFDAPADFDAEKIRRLLHKWNRKVALNTR